jgi:hypothetical protein
LSEAVTSGLPLSRRAGVLLMVFTLISCRHEQPKTVLARVADAELTPDVAKEHIDTLRGSAESQLQLYISSWINKELVYQEAKRKGIENSEEFLNKFRETKQQVANQIFLDGYLAGDTASVNDSTLKEYFGKHSTEFFVHENMMKLNIVLFANRERASTFSANISQRGNWDLNIKKLFMDSSAVSGSVTVMPAQYYSQHTLYPAELWKVASTLSVNDVSFPVKTSGGYAVLQATAAVQEGKPAEYEIVRDEVRERMIMERRRLKYEELLGTLRKRYNVELSTGSHPQPDSIQSRVHE